MSELKCPFCQQKLECFSVENRPVFACCNLNCKGYFMNAPKELWQELIRTRKALDIAVKRLGYIKNNYKSWTPDRDAQMIAQAVNGLDEIKTALEQKDIK